MIPFLILNGVILAIVSLALGVSDAKENRVLQAAITATFFCLAVVSLGFAFTL